MKEWRTPRNQFILALLVSSLVSIGLYLVGAWRNQSVHFGFLTWNLILAWLPLLFALKLLAVLKTKLWSSWEALAWSFLWLLFLPNSFYLISDLIHIFEIQRQDPLLDVVMFSSFVLNGMVLGYTSLYLVHRRLTKRLANRESTLVIAGIIFLCSAAIFIGRDLRWSSWDVVFNPGGVLFDVSDRISHPGDYPEMVMIVLAFFALLGSLYFLLWRGVQFMQNLPKSS